MKKKIYIILFMIIGLFTFTSCKDKNTEDTQIKVIFELEGGTYRNCTSAIVYCYDFDNETTNLIKDPYDLSKIEITKSGYYLEGWYKTKSIVNEKINYSDKWDFETDKISNDGIRLYAYWKKLVKYTYDVCYYNDNNTLVSLGIYDVEEGDEFSDYSNYLKKRIGYTAIGLKDIDGNIWQNDYKHPGGDDNTSIKVVVEFIKGAFAIVSNASELKANKNKNIYLTADIDFKNEELNFGDYKGIFMGNNHSISNFKVNYSATKNDLIEDFEDTNKKSLCISLFGNTNGANISDITFSNVTVDVKTSLTTTYKIYVAPISVSMTNTQLTNVNFSGNFSYSQLPTNFDSANNLVYVTDKTYYLADTTSVITDCTVNVTNN